LRLFIGHGPVGLTVRNTSILPLPSVLHAIKLTSTMRRPRSRLRT
jgi:hypothetical protein